MEILIVYILDGVHMTAIANCKAQFIRHKFNAKPTVIDNIRFQSQLESQYYTYLKQLQAVGEVLFFLRQTKLDLDMGSVVVGRYYCDFMVFYKDGSVEFVDVKGFETPEFKLKKQLVEAQYPFRLKIMKKGDF